MNDDLRQLRGKIDSDDPFMSGGHQILKVRKYKKTVPEWALKDSSIRKVVATSFPKWRTNIPQRIRAARWVSAIHLYYKIGMPRNHAAAEMGISKNAFKMLIRNINRAAAGKSPADNKPRGLRPRGRPKGSTNANSDTRRTPLVMQRTK